MKIMKVNSKKVGDKTYYKYIITPFPPEIAEKSKFIGKKLKAKLEKDKIIIEKE